MKDLVKATIVGLLILVSSNGFGQQKTDAKFIFKCWFYLEHENQNSPTSTSVSSKDSNLFSTFLSAFDLNLDTLKSSGFDSTFLFVAISRKNKRGIANDSAIKYSQSAQLNYVSIPVDNCNPTGYVLAVDEISGKSYRLHGFSGNDFLSLFAEINEKRSSKERLRALSIKSYVKKYVVEGVDFQCIYNGLTSGDQQYSKYPCLDKCSNAQIEVR